MYAGMGYRPLLLVQLLLFSTAAALLSVKLLLVAVTIDNVYVLQWLARYLILAGAVCAGANLTGLMVAMTWRQSTRGPLL
jgi:hypothetical protein